MNTIDYTYLCRTIGDLAAIPVRIFQGTDIIYYHSLVNLPKDPVILHLREIESIRENVGYFFTAELYYYGIVNTENIKIVLGPARQVGGSDQELREQAFLLGVAAEDTDVYISGMKSISRMPLESTLQMLCTLNYVLNGEKLKLQDIQIHKSEQENMKRNAEQLRSKEIDSSGFYPDEPAHNTISLENTLMNIVSHGDTAALLEWMANAPAIRGGTLAAEQLRQRKNMFIVAATLTSRAAIRGGMDVEDALSLSDRYIQSCEQLTAPDKIANLQYHMILEYTERVERVRKGRTPTPLVLSIANYVQHHLSDPVSAHDIATAFHLNRSYLTRRVKAETGDTLTDFILKEKTEEAKRLLRYTDKSITAIGTYLGFSSLGHFSRAFKKYTGRTPREYRDRFNG